MINSIECHRIIIIEKHNQIFVIHQYTSHSREQFIRIMNSIYIHFPLKNIETLISFIVCTLKTKIYNFTNKPECHSAPKNRKFAWENKSFCYLLVCLLLKIKFGQKRRNFWKLNKRSYTGDYIGTHKHNISSRIAFNHATWKFIEIIQIKFSPSMTK